MPHRHMLTRESAIDPAVVAERPYKTVRSRAELLDFKKYQRRPGLRVQLRSPDGVTGSAQIRPDKPRQDKRGKTIKYETAGGSEVILDVHPRMLGEVRRGDGDLFVTEGAKKADALVSRGLPAIALSGVWNWQRGGEMLPCWEHVQLAGRRMFVVYDADVMSNSNVQLALERLVAALEDRGAEILVVYLPDLKDGKTGVDDYLAAGHTVAELKMLARRFEREHIADVRLSRDAGLRAAVSDLWRGWRDADWMHFRGRAERGNWARGHTSRDVMKSLIDLSSTRGVLAGSAVEVEVGVRRLAELSAKSVPGVRKALSHLEAEEQLEILPPESREKARKYRLLPPRARVSQHGGSGGPGEKVTYESQGSDQGVKPLRAPSAPRLRWSSPGSPRRREFEVVPGRAVVRHRGRGAGGPEDGEQAGYIRRLGPHRGAVIDALEDAGGELHVEELCELLHRARPRDFKRRILAPLADVGIIEIEEERVLLAADWREKLEGERQRTGEIDQAEKQRAKHREQSKRYREHLEREKRGTPRASIEAAKRTHQLRERRLREIREERERDQEPTPPGVAALVEEILGKNERVRLELLCEIARDRKLRWRDVPPAVRRLGYRVERLSQYDNEPFVFAERGAA